MLLRVDRARPRIPADSFRRDCQSRCSTSN